ncbi:hypothetical protein AUP68_12122 [Ilyonectria robusta]
MSEPSINHPLMGVVEGKRVGEGIQFLGIKYASLSDRFAEAQLNEYNPGQGLDASSLGPFPISPASALNMETGIIQQSLPETKVPRMDGLECLNLNISVPNLPGGSNSARQLPVLVYLHGGAFLFGSNWYPHYSQEKFVELAQRRGSAVIAVILNYRLGLPGLMTSHELRAAGYKANNTLRDQKVAFRWIKKYIHGFGGDPNSITAIGQSAGAISICYHLQSTEALFHQAAILGGSNITMGPATLEAAETIYNNVKSSLKLGDLTPEDRIKSLLAASESDLLGQADFVAGFNLVADQDVIPETITLSSLTKESDRLLPGKAWCQRLLVVQGNLEASVAGFLFLAARQEGIAKAFCTFMKENFENTAAVERLLGLYDLSPKTKDSDALIAIMEYFNDVSFYAPACLLASLWPKGYVGNFNEGNPWNGPNRGKANHMLDTAFLFQQYNSRMAAPQRAVAEAYATDIAAFVAGLDALPQFTDGEQLVAWGPSNEGAIHQVTSRASKSSGRRPDFFDVVDDLGGLSALLSGYEKFLRGA